MVEVVESDWGDWWIVVDGEPVAVHIHTPTHNAHDAAVAHARSLFSPDPPHVRPFGDVLRSRAA